MSKTCEVPWASWYGDTSYALSFPDEMNVTISPMTDAPELSREEIVTALEQPIGTSRLNELARGKTRCVVLFDDLTRPTPLRTIAEHTVQALEQAGVRKQDICFLSALGAHRPMTRQEFTKKLGKRIVDEYKVVNHDAHHDVAKLEVDCPIGYDVFINRRFLEADLRIAMGCIAPHSLLTFSGGGKIVLPGIAGIETIAASHALGYRNEQGRAIQLPTPSFQENILCKHVATVARQAGLDYIVNVVVNSQGKIAGVHAGDPVAAHKEGVRQASHVYSTNLIPDQDIMVMNAYPKDTEFLQSVNALNLIKMDRSFPMHSDATVVITTAGSEGLGHHDLVDLESFRFDDVLKGYCQRRVLFFCPSINLEQVSPLCKSDGAVCFNDWNALVDYLKRDYAGRPDLNVVVYPTAPFQIKAQSAHFVNRGSIMW